MARLATMDVRQLSRPRKRSQTKASSAAGGSKPVSEVAGQTAPEQGRAPALAPEKAEPDEGERCGGDLEADDRDDRDEDDHRGQTRQHQPAGAAEALGVGGAPGGRDERQAE